MATERPHDESYEKHKTKGLPPLVASVVAPAAPATKSVELHALRAVHGLLIHPYTQARFNTDKPLDHELDGWCKIQIEYGKLVVV